MIAKRDNKHRAVELLKSIFENNFYSQDERRMLSPHTLKEYTDRCQRYQTTITTAITTTKIAIVDRPLLQKIWGDYIWPVLKSFANLGVILMNLCVGGGRTAVINILIF